MELTTHLHLVQRSRMEELYLHSRMYLHGIMLNNIIKYRDNFSFFPLWLYSPIQALAVSMKLQLLG
jgi:hypothetical protein